MAATNKDKVRDMFAKAKEKVNGAIIDVLIDACHNLLQNAEVHKTYYNVTGNTFTSYSCGLYLDGELQCIFSSSDTHRPPTRLTLKKGERYNLDTYYDGGDAKQRKFKAPSGNENYLGADKAKAFLFGYAPTCRKGFSVCMCTGTYYSEFLEKTENLNVLTDTFQDAGNIVINSLKKVKL